LGISGFVVTLGLFFYELFGIKKCTYLIRAGKDLETKLNVRDGQFTRRPHGIAGFISEPLASDLIYPAVLAAWRFLALFSPKSQDAARRDALRVFFIGFAISFIYYLILILQRDLKITAFLKKTYPRLFLLMNPEPVTGDGKPTTPPNK
jgi:hypothetical protein